MNMNRMTRLLTGTLTALALVLPAAATEYRIAVGDGAGGTQEALGQGLRRRTGGKIGRRR
jgi:hypothetical protein